MINVAIAMLLGPVAALWLLPLIAELLALVSRRPVAVAPPPPRARLLVLVPAHDEEQLIGACVRSLRAMERRHADAEIVVVADNCRDATAARARDGGARVLERADPARRGKPHAIQWVLDQTDLTAYDAVVIVDADSTVTAAFADSLAQMGPLRDKAVQGYFSLSNEAGSWLSRLAGLLARVRYEGQYVLKQRAGLNCPLTGNGMCLGTGLLARAGWAPDALTENWELYARYTSRGERIDYAPRAMLWSEEASSLAQGSTQRLRWQAGRLNALRTYARPLLTSNTIGLTQRIDALAELTTPGPMLHLAGAGILALICGLLPGTTAVILAWAFAASAVPMVVWTARAWRRSDDPAAIAAALTRVPLYLLWRIAVAVAAVVSSRRLAWHRSPRAPTRAKLP
jgi:1,2-diacylglycerol 3-beta-glucosyltransferase